MLKIVIASDNLYYRKGVESLIMSAGTTLRDRVFEVVSERDSLAVKEANIVFRDIMISVFFYPREKHPVKKKAENHLTVLHIPFICRGENLPQLTGKIRKIMLIADTHLAGPVSGKDYNPSGLKNFMQLSSTESKVMLMIGQGYDTENISRMLGRSKKTVSTHCRNAIRKMGMLNRAEFYKYAAFIVKSGNRKGNTLCL